MTQELWQELLLANLTDIRSLVSEFHPVKGTILDITDTQKLLDVLYETLWTMPKTIEGHRAGFCALCDLCNGSWVFMEEIC